MTVPKRVVKLSAASRKAVVKMALSLLASTGTSLNLFLSVSKKVPPGGYAADIVLEDHSIVLEARAGIDPASEIGNVMLYKVA